MQRWQSIFVIIGMSALSTVAVRSASLDDGKAAFEHREDTMKHMGRPLYLGIGRVVKGTAAYGPDTIAAAETVASLASTLDRSLFPPGSDVDGSKIKPEIFAAGDHHNDVSMLDGRFAAMPACPANAIDNVKDAVRSAGGYVAEREYGAGVHEALLHFTQN